MTSSERHAERTVSGLFWLVAFLMCVITGSGSYFVTRLNDDAKRISDQSCFNTSIANVIAIGAEDRRVNDALTNAEARVILANDPHGLPALQLAFSTWQRQRQADDRLRAVNPVKTHC